MKRNGIFSRLKLRVIPMLMAASLLCSNFVTIDAFADEPAQEAGTDQTVDPSGEGQEGEGQEGEGQEGENQNGEGQQGEGQEGENQNGEGQEGENQNGEGQEGENQNGEGQQGEGQEGENQNGEGQQGEGQQGEGQEGENQNGEGQEGEGQEGEGQDPEDLEGFETDMNLSQEALNSSGGTPITDLKELGYINVVFSSNAGENVTLTVKGNVGKKDSEGHSYTEQSILADGENLILPEGSTLTFNYSFEVEDSNTTKEDYIVIAKYDGESDFANVTNGVITVDNCGDKQEQHTLEVEVKRHDSKNPTVDYLKDHMHGSPDNLYVSTSADELTFYAKATDNIGVTKVELVTDSGSITMSYDDGEYYWKPSAHGVYHITGVVAYDAAENASEGNNNFDITVNYYSASSEYEISVDILNKREWYSSNSNNVDKKTAPIISIHGFCKSMQGIKDVVMMLPGDEKEIIPVDYYDVIEIAGLQYWNVKVTLDVSSLNSNTNTISFYPEYNNQLKGSIEYITINVDNKAPTGEVSFYNDEISGYEYTKTTVDNVTSIYTNQDLNPAIIVNTTDELSYVSYVLNGHTIKVDNLTKDANGNIKIDIDYKRVHDRYGKYTIEHVRLVDQAGNYYESEKSLSYFYDGCGPDAIFEIERYGRWYQYKQFVTDQNEIVIRVTITDDVSLDIENNPPVFMIGDTGKEIPKDDIKVDETFQSSERAVRYLVTLKADHGWDDIYIKLKVMDLAKNESTKMGPSMIIDTIEPVLWFEYDPVPHTTPYGGDEFFSTSNVEVRAIVEEKYPNKEVIAGAIHVKGQTSGELQASWKLVCENGVNRYIGTFTTTVDDCYEITIDEPNYGWDFVDHGYVWNTEKTFIPKFTVDSKSPEVSIAFDNEDVRNGKYYNKARTATITVKDTSFAKDASLVEIKSQYGSATAGEFTGSDGVFTATVPFTQDGIYSFTVTAYDKAGNAPDIESVEEFVIDQTEPKLSIEYNNNDVRNQMYYNASRMATVTVEDMTFSSDLVDYGMQPIADGSPLPALGSFSTSDMVNTSYMAFDQDGTYAFVINCTDLAGNTSTSYISEVFVIDTTAPEVNFSGVENYSANNGTVAPTVSYIDKNMDMDATVVTMTGSNNGPVSVGNAVTKTENGFVVSYNDFAHDKSMDDLYTLTAKVYDLAGNESEEQLVFSVNRYGSVFVLGDAAKALNEDFYTNDPQDITITEINVDELTYRDVSISCDGEVIDLKKDSDYTVTAQGSDTTWKTYTYTLKSDNFNKDGVYSVTVYTKDKATNAQDNKSRDAEINFAVDLTKPSIVTAGIADNQEYNEETHNVNINVADNMGLVSFEIFRNDKKIGSYTAEELETNGGTIEVALDEADKKAFDLKLVAVDVAGNEETITYSNVTVSSDTKEITNGGVPGSSGNEGGNCNHLILFIILGLCVVAMASGAGVYAYKKKKVTE